VAAQTNSTSFSTISNETSTQLNSNQTLQLPSQEFSTRVLATNFSAPHNILYGQDGALWITERIGKNITRVDPNSGERLSSMPVPNVYQTGAQDGLMGMAFDSDFNSTHYIYVAYTYSAAPSNISSADGNTSSDDAASNDTREEADQWRRTKITRFTYNPEGASIGNPVDLISGLAGSNDHNSGRMIFGLDGKLYNTIGDQGNNQFDRYCMPIKAQVLPTQEQVEAGNWTAYQGKVLRMNPDGSIPEDNPEINGVESHLYVWPSQCAGDRPRS
jgi:PQQ-dependent dehydrogenase (s-GDH family)